VTRRNFLFLAATPAALPPRLSIPLHILLDGQAAWKPRQLDRFWWHIWPESVRDFRHAGIQFQTNWTVGSVQRPPGVEPYIVSLNRKAVNLVVTNLIPTRWDQGRAWSGVSTRFHGSHVCMVALDRAHGNQVPLLSVNTCTHELLHALMLDLFENRPGGLAGQAREFRIDRLATWLWLFHDGRVIRAAAQNYVDRLSRDGGR
jgi:hypothetical protein